MDSYKHKSVKPQKVDSEAWAKWKEFRGKPGNINELILNTKSDLKEGLDNI